MNKQKCTSCGGAWKRGISSMTCGVCGAGIVVEKTTVKKQPVFISTDEEETAFKQKQNGKRTYEL